MPLTRGGIRQPAAGTTDPFSQDEAKCEPSGENASAHGIVSSHLRVQTVCCPAIFQMMIEVSSEPLRVASHLPSGEMASDITDPLWPFSLIISAPDILVLRSTDFVRL